MTRISDSALGDYLKSLTPTGALEELIEAPAPPEGNLEAAGGREGAPAGDVGRRTLEKLERGEVLAPDERHHLEAVIIPDRRPAIDIVGGDYSTSHFLWSHLNDAEIRTRLRGLFPSIGRIELPGHPTLPYGGTGFVVGDGLLMTNRHVAEIFAHGLGTTGLRFITGLGAGIDFVKERRHLDDSMLRITGIAMIHPYWDMALLRIDNLPAVHGALQLSTADNTELTGREVAVVGYPSFDPRNPSDVQNDVFAGVYGVKRLQPGHLLAVRAMQSYGHDVRAATHDSSTLAGNSGSCVIDIASGEVVGLHFGGRYSQTNYCVPAGELARDGRVVDSGVAFATPPRPEPTQWDRAWVEISATEPGENSAPVETGDLSMSSDGSSNGSSVTHFTIPLQITVRLGAPDSDGAGAPAITADAASEKNVEPFHDTDYANRAGYDPGFLGVDAPLPTPRNMTDLVRMADDSHVIPYNNFSVAMHAGRRLALYTAANVDASRTAKRPGEKPDNAYTRKGLSGLGKNDREKWFGDPRLRANEQLPDKFFTRDRTAFDKGHVVRRDDVAWGATYDEMRCANGDTYHVTNCSPQVLGFNRSSRGLDNWGDLENLVLGQADTERLAVFGGPVLDADDPIFSGVDTEGPVAVKIPRRYWKLIVAEKGGALQSFGFVLEQDLSNVELEFTVPQRWEQFMKPVDEIEDLARIDFDQVIREADQAGTPNGESLATAAGIAASAPSSADKTAPPPAAPDNADVRDILDFWRAQRGTGEADADDVRFVLNLDGPAADADLAAALSQALGLEVTVGPLFEGDPDLDRYRLVEIPGVQSDDRSALFDIARYMRDVTGARTVDPDLATHYFDSDDTPPPEGAAESADWAFWFWVDPDRHAPDDADWAINKTLVPEAWTASEAQNRPSRGSGIVIFQPDTGVAPTHTELPAGIHLDPRAANFIEPGTPPVDPMTGGGNIGHGTSTASVAASPTAGALRGSAPDASLVPIRCTRSVSVFNQSRVAQAINHARRNGAHVITLSLGGVFSSALHAAVKMAVDANIIVLAAAGNCVGAVVWPARYDEMIAVAGINEDFNPWIGSSNGRAVDISGPAELVLRADARDPGNMSKVAAGQGTSYAVAHLAGVAACWLAHHGRDALLGQLGGTGKLQDLFRALMERTAMAPPGFNTDDFGAGIVNAEDLIGADPVLAAGPEAVAEPARSTRQLVEELLAQTAGAGGLEAAGPALDDGQNLIELACLGLDMAQRGKNPRAPIEALPPPRLSKGLRQLMDPGATERTFGRGEQ
ncbi:MAG: DNA/RNA non-specific endonuclease [Pseudomonadota bacterium]|nr:DNA/RNA non-specific endonuclease [Pseudomonadota bacterium]